MPAGDMLAKIGKMAGDIEGKRNPGVYKKNYFDC
jgi:hypothetical protein